MKDPVKSRNIMCETKEAVVRNAEENDAFDGTGCNDACLDNQSINIGLVKKKGLISRFLDRLAKVNKQSFGGSPPRCH